MPLHHNSSTALSQEADGLDQKAMASQKNLKRLSQKMSIKRINTKSPLMKESTDFFTSAAYLEAMQDSESEDSDRGDRDLGCSDVSSSFESESASPALERKQSQQNIKKCYTLNLIETGKLSHDGQP